MKTVLSEQKDNIQTQNTTMLILQCIGIIAVVLGHCDTGGTSIPLFLKYPFPYYSWHMPFFIFISGYFFNRRLSAGQFIFKKAKTLLLPAMLFNLGYGVISSCLAKFGLATYGKKITLRALFVTPFTTGYQFVINVSFWFIFALFVIEVIACIMDRLTHRKADLLYLAITLVVAVWCCYTCYYDHEGTRKEFLNAGYRLGYLMFFFWLGICYRKYFEKPMRAVLTPKFSLFLFLLQTFLFGITLYKTAFNVRDMNFYMTVPDGFWVAIVTPVTATAFFLGIAYSLAPRFEDCKPLQTLGRNTKYVVYHHQFLFVFFSIILGVLIKLNILPHFNGFDFEKLHKGQYYASGNPAIACVICVLSIILPVKIGCWIQKKRWYIGAMIYLAILALIIATLYLASTVLV